ncbi:MAG: hypothetical protein ACOYMU_05600 [Phycisphaerales bacterium]
MQTVLRRRASQRPIPLRRCRPCFAATDSAAKMQTGFAATDSAATMQTALRSDGFS